MNNTKRYIVTLTLFLTLHIKSIIIESDTLDVVLKHADKDTIVVFDIDDTIAQLPEDIGTSKWLSYMTKQLQTKGYSFEEALNIMIPSCCVIQLMTELKMVGSSFQIINTLQQNNIKTMALTNRSISIEKRTIEQLKNLGIDFSANCVCDDELALNLKHRGKFSHGIIFTANNTKGEMLFHFLDITKQHFKKVVFVDDKLKHVKEVEKEAQKQNIEFIGIRFSQLDDKVQSFDPEKARKQFNEFKIMLGWNPIKS